MVIVWSYVCDGRTTVIGSPSRSRRSNRYRSHAALSRLYCQNGFDSGVPSRIGRTPVGFWYARCRADEHVLVRPTLDLRQRLRDLAGGERQEVAHRVEVPVADRGVDGPGLAHVGGDQLDPVRHGSYGRLPTVEDRDLPAALRRQRHAARADHSCATKEENSPVHGAHPTSSQPGSEQASGVRQRVVTGGRVRDERLTQRAR